MRSVFPAVLSALLLLPAPAVEAHKSSDSYLGITAGDEMAGEWKIALRDLEFAIGVDGDGDGAITWGELTSRQKDINAYALSRLAIASDGGDCPLRPTDHLADLLSDGGYAVLRFAIECETPNHSIDIRYDLLFDLDRQHRGLLRLDVTGTTRSAIFGPETNRQSFDVTTGSPVRQFAAYVREGIWHIWIGYDHILFLVTLLLPAVLRRHPIGWEAAPRFRDGFLQSAGIITAFTLAHSCTLSLAALGVIGLPSRFVESAIAASIIIAAINNIYPLVTRRLWLVAFAFGLVHGFGFANVLLDLGLPRGALLMSLVAFNLGVEIGQLAIVAALLPVIHIACRWRHYPRAVLQAGSLVIVSLASLWFIERTFDVASLW